MDTMWTIERNGGGYPGELERYLGEDAPPRLVGRGNPELLGVGGIALFSSRHCPGTQASRMVDLAQRIRDRGRPALGGFHSGMEKECLRILLKSPYPVIVGVPRSLERARLPAEWGRAIEDGRMLVLSAAPASERRTTAAGARRRNEVLAALADEILIAHAEAGGATERFCRTLVAWGKPVVCPDVGDTAVLIGLGAEPVNSDWLTAKDRRP